MLGLGVHDDVIGQIFIHASQTIAQPRPETGSPRDLAARLDISDCGVVIDRLGKSTVNHAQVLDHFRGVRKQRTYPNTLVVIFALGELVLARSQGKGFLTRSHARDPLAIPHVIGQVLSEFLYQLGFVIP